MDIHQSDCRAVLLSAAEPSGWQPKAPRGQCLGSSAHCSVSLHAACVGTASAHVVLKRSAMIFLFHFSNLKCVLGLKVCPKAQTTLTLILALPFLLPVGGWQVLIFLMS